MKTAFGLLSSVNLDESVTVRMKESPANQVPAAAVIRREQAFAGFMGCKGSCGGNGLCNGKGGADPVNGIAKWICGGE